MSSFWQFVYIQMAIFRRVRFGLFYIFDINAIKYNVVAQLTAHQMYVFILGYHTHTLLEICTTDKLHWRKAFLYLLYTVTL